MNSSSLRIVPLLIVTIFTLFLITSYIVTTILPYQFPNQWKPTAETINITGQYDTSNEKGEFLGKQVTSTDITGEIPSSTVVLGDTDGADKHIEVDLTNQKVYAFEGSSKVMEFLISSGKWGKTPTGHFTIGYKTMAQKMSGGNRALGTYYYLPNVQFVQFFGNDEIPWSRGFSFHGTYWHENFGTPMSHGCLNMRNEDAEKLFYWTTPSMGDSRTLKATEENPGTPVFIYGQYQYPQS